MEKLKNNKIQILRAIAIISVILIHLCPNMKFEIYFRPFINFGVAIFIFLSGFLTKIENDNWISFYKKRITRVIIPYVIWTLIYSLINNAFSVRNILKNLITTKSASILYYIFVYIQFTLLTPLIGKLAKSKFNWIGWLITPFSLIIFVYFPLIKNIQLNYKISLLWSVCCLGWFTFYYLGLLLGNNIIDKKFNVIFLSIILILSIFLQIFEARIWFRNGNYSCGSQLKITTIITNTIITLLSYLFITMKKDFNNKFLTLIGDLSFGMFFFHILPLKFLETNNYLFTLPYIINFIIIFTVTFLFVLVTQKICGKKISKYLGLI